MTSFQIAISDSRTVATRFISRVRREIHKALAEESKKRGLTQSDIAREIGVHRSVISRELRGQKDISLGRVGEIAHALGRDPEFFLREEEIDQASNFRPDSFSIKIGGGTTSIATSLIKPDVLRTA